MNPIVTAVAQQIQHEDKAQRYAAQAEKLEKSFPKEAVVCASLAVYHQLATEARRAEVERLDKEV